VADLTGAGAAPPGSRTPESLLQFLTEHRQSIDRRRGPKTGPKTGRMVRTAIALVVLAAVLVVWGGFTHFRFVSRGPAGASAARQGSTPTAGGGTTHAAKASGPKTIVANTERTAARQADLWHRGLQAWPDPAKPRIPDIYYKWLHSNYSCAVYATYGCWKARVVTRHGCPHGFNILVHETQNGVQVGVTGRFIARLLPQTPRTIEVDADRAHVDGQVSSMSCN
jgi:hypothetical protein